MADRPEGMTPATGLDNISVRMSVKCGSRTHTNTSSAIMVRSAFRCRFVMLCTTISSGISDNLCTGKLPKDAAIRSSLRGSICTLCTHAERKHNTLVSPVGFAMVPMGAGSFFADGVLKLPHHLHLKCDIS